MEAAETAKHPSGRGTLKEAVATRRVHWLPAVVQAVGQSPEEAIAEWAGQLLDGFAAEMEGKTSGSFLSVLEDVLRQVVTVGEAISTDPGQYVDAWQAAVAVLRRNTLPYLEGEVRMRADGLWRQANVLIGQTAQRARARQVLRAEGQVQMLREIEEALVTASDVGELVDALEQSLPRLGIPSCYLSLYENPTHYEYPQPVPEWSRLVLAYDADLDSQRIELEPDGRRFPTHQLVPDGTLPQNRWYSFMVVPLYMRENQLGFGLFEVGPRDAGVYEALRQGLSSALHGALLVQRTRDYAVRLQTAAEVSHAASSILDPDELIQQVVNLVQDRFDLYYAGLFLVEDEGTEDKPGGAWAVLRAATGEAGRQMLAQGHRLEVGGESMIGWCVANKQARIALDVGEDAVRFENPLLPKTRSELALPLVSRGQAIGALTIQSAQEAAFSDEDIAVLQTMADQLANTIANARLFEQAQAHTEEFAVLNEMARALTATLDVGTVLQNVYHHTSRLMDTSNLYVALYDVQKDEVSFPFYLVEGEPIAHVESRQTGKGLTEYVLRTRQPFLVAENIAAQLKELGIEMVGREAQSWLGAPMITGDQVVGVIAVQSYTTPRAYNEHHRDLLSAIANQTAIAVQNTRLFEQMQDALGEVEATQRRYLGRAWTEYLRSARVTGYETRQADGAPLDDALLREVQQAAEQQRTTALTVNGGAAEERSALVAPVTLRGMVIGALGVHDEGARQWTEEEIALIEAIAERVALAAENLRLLEETQRRAAHERLVGEVAARMRETLDMDTVLQTAIRSIGDALDIAEVEVRMYGDATTGR
jgi:GAF domain-containing protein